MDVKYFGTPVFIDEFACRKPPSEIPEILKQVENKEAFYRISRLAMELGLAVSVELTKRPTPGPAYTNKL